MFACGEWVVYGIHGVCKVLDLEMRSVDRKPAHYYVLEPLNQTGDRYYIPTQNQAATAKLRPILTRAQLDELLADSQCSSWIADENQRKQLYRTLINNTDPAELIRIVRMLYRQKEELLVSGKKFHLCDENFLRDAEKLLNTEFSLILNMDQQEVKEYVRRAIGITD